MSRRMLYRQGWTGMAAAPVVGSPPSRGRGGPERPAGDRGARSGGVTGARPAATRARPPSREAAREIAIGLAIFGVYLGVTHGLAVSRADADARGADLLAAERWLRIAVTDPLNRALTGHPKLEVLAAWEYATTYIITTFGLLGLLWARGDPTYRWARDSLAVTTLLGVACFALWPTTPPRLLPGEPFDDTVAIHHPPLSWGGGPVSAGANQFAAMPSLHVAWAVWVVAATVRARRVGPVGKALGAAHLGVTVVVVLATANHYVLDVVAGAAAFAAAVPVADRLTRRARSGGRRVPAPDELFLHVQTPTNPQYVGGVAILDSGPAGPPTLGALRHHVGARLPAMTRLTRRVQPAGRLRHHRWTASGPIDLAWHVQEETLGPPGGRRGLEAFVARVSAVSLDAERPPWRLWLVHGVGPGRAAVVVVVHHSVADGLGVVALLRHLLDPVPTGTDPSGADAISATRAASSSTVTSAISAGAISTRASAARRVAGRALRPAVVLGGLVRLGQDGTAPPMALCGPLGPSRAYLTSAWPLDELRACAARLDTRVTDLLLAAAGDAATAALTATARDPAGRRLRAAVPVTLRMPGPDRDGVPRGPGNLTAALRLDVPLGPMPVARRAQLVAVSARARRESGRLPASAVALRLMGVLPAVLHRRAARAVYRARYFTAIVSNMRGAPRPLGLLGRPLLDVFPILPLADEVPVSVGALGWNGRYCVAATVDPARVDPAAFAAGLRGAFADLIAMERAARAAADGPAPRLARAGEAPCAGPAAQPGEPTRTGGAARPGRAAQLGEAPQVRTS